MEAPTQSPSLPPTKRRRLLPRPHFGIGTLLWLVVLVSAFFVGRQSDEIWARFLYFLPNKTSYQLLQRSDGSLLFVHKSQATGVSFRGPQICTATHLDENRIQLKAQRDGTTQATFQQYYDGETLPRFVSLDLSVVKGRISVTKQTVVTTKHKPDSD